MRELPAAMWRHPRDFSYVELWGCGWTDEQLAAVMDGWHWAGDVNGLVMRLSRDTGQALRCEIWRGIGGADDRYVVAPLGIPTSEIS